MKNTTVSKSIALFNNADLMLIGMSDEGVELVTNFSFPNMKKRYNILPAMFGCRDRPTIIEFTNENRNFFAVWAYAAIHIDHDQFLRYLYHTLSKFLNDLEYIIIHILVNYHGKKNSVDDIQPLKLNDIEPMTYAKFLYETGLCMLKFSSSIYKLMKSKNVLGVQSEHIIEAFFG